MLVIVVFIICGRIVGSLSAGGMQNGGSAISAGSSQTGISIIPIMTLGDGVVGSFFN